jgi:2-oxoglutarate dehydrogenase E2 component (dihydrolipoamide succinyltransferase)
VPATPPAGSAEEPASSPAARHIAAEHGIDLARVAGSGRAGRITKEDVVSYVEQARAAAAAPSEPTSAAPAPPPAPPQPAAAPAAAPARAESPSAALDGRREERVRMTRRRQVIAQRLVEAQQTAAMLTTFNEVDMSAIMDVRKRRRESFEKRHGVRLGFMSFFTKAVVGALKAQPLLNAEVQGDEIVLKHYYDIGIAVGAEGGLVVPVVRDADRKSFADIEREIGELGEKARNNTLRLDELQGGTFTITNGGIFGSLLSTPILNPPQVGILGMHKIEERPVVAGGQIVIRPMMYLALSYDHRIVDGREAVTFLVRIKELLEDPETLLLEG